jgi:hypothetical protein
MGRIATWPCGVSGYCPRLTACRTFDHERKQTIVQDGGSKGNNSVFPSHLAAYEDANDVSDDVQCRYTSISLVSTASIHSNAQRFDTLSLTCHDALPSTAYKAFMIFQRMRRYGLLPIDLLSRVNCSTLIVSTLSPTPKTRMNTPG